MGFTYTSLSDDREVHFDKHGTDCTVLRPADFDEYKKQMEKQGRYVHVVGVTSFKKFRKDADDEDMCFVSVPGRENGQVLLFKVYKHRRRVHTAGYLPVSEVDFIRVENWFLFAWFLLLFFLVLLFLYNKGIPDLPSVPDDDAHDYLDGDYEGGQSDNTVIPGFTKIEAKKGSSGVVQLYNPDVNTVKFVYVITEEVSQGVAGVFGSASEAQAYVAAHEKHYSNDYDSGKYQLVDDDTGEKTDTYVDYAVNSRGDKWEVIETKSRVLYFTKAIAPGKAVDWNVKEVLGVGEHELKFFISTYDVETNAECYGAVLDVKAVIE